MRERECVCMCACFHLAAVNIKSWASLFWPLSFTPHPSLALFNLAFYWYINLFGTLSLCQSKAIWIGVCIECAKTPCCSWSIKVKANRKLQPVWMCWRHLHEKTRTELLLYIAWFECKMKMEKKLGPEKDMAFVRHRRRPVETIKHSDDVINRKL